MLIYNKNRGRLGNSIFRLFSNIIFSIVNDVDAQIFCDTTDIYSYIVDDTYFINFMNVILNDLKPTKIDANAKLLFDGYYQHDRVYVKYKEQIIDYIKTHQDIIIKTDRNDAYKIGNLLDCKIEKKYRVVIHLRLEDFIEISQAINPNSIKNVIDKIINEFRDEPICFVLNKPQTDLEIRYINFLKNIYSNIIFESNDVITDFIIMRQSNILVCSCSTLSWTAVILSKTIEKVYMPDYKNINGFHQTCKYPHPNTELYSCETCSQEELCNILL